MNLSAFASVAASSEDPEWWSTGSPPVINGEAENNKGPANVGQAKWMAMSALEALRVKLGAGSSVVLQIESKLYKASETAEEGIFYPMRPTSVTVSWQETQKAPLQNGALKALAVPFYDSLKAHYPRWLASQLEKNGTKNEGENNYYPWTTTTDDDDNTAIVALGQLKAVFALRFEEIDINPNADTDNDGLPDVWELRYFENLEEDGLGDPDEDGKSNLEEFNDGTSPLIVDTSEIPKPQFIPGNSDSPIYLNVVVKVDVPHALIRYTTNGQEPTLDDLKIYSGDTIPIRKNCVLKARTWVDGKSSEIESVKYQITGAIDVGSEHVLAMGAGGRLWAWGSQASGRLGNGLTSNAVITSPSAVLASLSNQFESAWAVSAGNNHSVVLDQDRKVWAFGENSDGQLGDNTTTDAAIPVQVFRTEDETVSLEDCAGVAAGDSFSIALESDGTPLSWGLESGGRLGNGRHTETAQLHASNIVRGDDPEYPILTSIRQVSAGNSHGLARNAHSSEIEGGNGKVWVWGSNHTGQLGLGNTSDASRALPMRLNEGLVLTDALDVAGGEAHTAVVRWNSTVPNLVGTVWCCGLGTDGRLGNGSSAGNNVLYPAQVLRAPGIPLTHISRITAGSAHTLALDCNGFVWAWGNNSSGQLGDGTTQNSEYAKLVTTAEGSLLQEIVAISAGGNGSQGRSMAISADGTIWIWGWDQQALLGTGEVPQAITRPTALPYNYIKEEGAPSLEISCVVNEERAPGDAVLSFNPMHSGPDGGSMIAKVEVFLNGELTSILTEPPWVFNVTNLPSGDYRAFGVVTDTSGVRVASESIQFSIVADPLFDSDGDGISNDDEISLGLDPLNSDSDGDGMEDGWENYYDFPALEGASNLAGLVGSNDDMDSDGVTNLQEHMKGLRPDAQGRVSLSAETESVSSIKWFARRGFVYFIEYSSDSINWRRLTNIFLGENSEIQEQVDLGDLEAATSAEFKLSSYSPIFPNDWDGDGIPNDYELFVSASDPLNAESQGADLNSNGIPDGWENFNFGSEPTVIAAPGEGSVDRSKRELFRPTQIDP